jgi:hypothetical protein
MLVVVVVVLLVELDILAETLLVLVEMVDKVFLLNKVGQALQ